MNKEKRERDGVKKNLKDKMVWLTRVLYSLIINRRLLTGTEIVLRSHNTNPSKTKVITPMSFVVK